MVTAKPVKLRHVGVDLSKMPPASEVVPGRDFPVGILSVDMTWYGERLTVDRLAECDDAGLIEMRVEARQYCEMMRLRALAGLVGPGGAA